MRRPNETEKLFWPEKKKQRRNHNNSSLPVEILIKILSQVATDDLLRNVAIVSKQFYEITKYPEVHLNVRILFCSDPAKGVHFLQRTTRIRELIVSGKKEVVVGCEPLLLAVRTHPHLRALKCVPMISEKCFIELSEAVWWTKLTLIDVIVGSPNPFANRPPQEPYSNESDDDEEADLAEGHLEQAEANEEQALIVEDEEAADANPEPILEGPIVRPFLFFANDSDDDFDLAVQDLGSDGGLTHFALNVKDESKDHGYESHFRSDAIHEVMTNPNYKKLRSIVIYADMEDEALEEVIEARKDTLEELKVENYAGTRGFQYEAYDQLRNVPNLKKLTVIESIFENFQVLSSLKQLTTLKFDMCGYYELETLPPNSLLNLTHLYLASDFLEMDFLNYNALTVDIARASPNLIVFENLIVFNSNIECLAEVIKNCQKLEKLTFRVNSGFKHIDLLVPDIRESLTKIRCLDLDGWIMTEGNARQLVRECPDMITLRVNGRVYSRACVTMKEIDAIFDAQKGTSVTSV